MAKAGASRNTQVAAARTNRAANHRAVVAVKPASTGRFKILKKTGGFKSVRTER